MLESDHREQRSNRDEDMVGSEGIIRGGKKKKKKKYTKRAQLLSAMAVLHPLRLCYETPPPAAWPISVTRY